MKKKTQKLVVSVLAGLLAAVMVLSLVLSILPVRAAATKSSSEIQEQINALEEQISGYEYQVRACMKALKDGAIECPEMPHSETIRIMEIMDSLRETWGVRYPFE